MNACISANPRPVRSPNEPRIPNGLDRLHQPSTCGFALISALILLASCTILVIGYLTISRNEVLTARRYADRLRAEMANVSGFEEAKLLLQQTTNNDSYLVTMVPNRSTMQTSGWGNNDAKNDGDPDDAHLNDYYFISQPREDGSVDHVPLFAGGERHTTSIYEGPTWQRDATLDPADGVLGTASQSFFTPTSTEPIREEKSPATAWLRPPSGGQRSSSSPSSPPPPNKRDQSGMRYTYWIEDLQGLVQYDKIGYYRVEPDWVSAPTYSQGNSGHGFNAESFGASIGDSLLLGFPAGDPRHADPKRGGRILDRFSKSLHYQNYWLPHALRNPYLGAGAAVQSDLAGQLAPGLSIKEFTCSYQFHYWTEKIGREMLMSRAGGVLSSGSQGIIINWGLGWTAYGLRPYLERQRVPKGFGYATDIDPDGKASGFQPGDRGNLNLWVAEGGQSGAEKLATYLDAVLPEATEVYPGTGALAGQPVVFAGWKERGGGILESLKTSDRPAPTFAGTYLRALAANIIDYADTDSIPTRDAAGLERGTMRGVEALPMVNETAFLFRWEEKTRMSGPDRWKIVFKLTPIIEFWNPTNQPVSNRDVGLVIWDRSPGNAATGSRGLLASRVATHYRLPAMGPYPAATMGPGDKSGFLVDVVSGKTSRLKSKDLILWKNVDLPANGFVVQVFDPVEFVFEYPVIGDFSDPTIEQEIDEILLRGETRSGGLAGNDRASRYAMVLAGPSGVSQRVEDHLLYDEAHGRTDRHGGGNARFVWPGHPTRKPNRNVYACSHAAHDGYDHESSARGRVINVGDPFASFYLTNLQRLIGFRDSSSLGGRNYRKSTSIGGDNDVTWQAGAWQRHLPWGNHVKTQKEVRVPYWPDGGYLTRRGTPFIGDEEDPLPGGYGGILADGYATAELDCDDDGTADERERLMAPYRLNNSGRYWSPTELGHVWDPVFWKDERETEAWEFAAEFDDAATGLGPTKPTDPRNARVGGGSTLRIGRPEHARLRRDTAQLGTTPTDDHWPATALLDILATGTNGSNVGTLDDPHGYDPMWHIEPPTARNATEAADPNFDSYHIYGPHLHAESPYRWINGNLNLNTARTGIGIWAASICPFTSDPGYGTNHKDPESGVDWENWGVNRWGPDLRALLFSSRPFYSPSQFAWIWNLAEQRGTSGPGSSPDYPWNQWVTESKWGGEEFGRFQDGSYQANKRSDPYRRSSSSWVDMSDAVREEQFARTFNLCNFSSRNFRILVMGEYLAPNGEPTAASRKVYEVFAKPIRNADGLVVEVKIEVLSVRDQ